MADLLRTDYKTFDPNPAAAFNETNAAVNRTPVVVATMVDPGILVASSERFSIDPTGSVSSHAGINAALAAAPNGTTVTFPQGARLRVGGALVIPSEKNLTVDFSGVTLVRDFSGTMLTCSSTIEAPVTVSAFSEITETVDGGTQSHVVSTITVSPVPSTWAAGDTLRIVSDDIIPGENYNVGDTGHMRYGEYVHIYAIDGTTVKLTTTLRDPYVTNIRVAKISAGSVNVVNLTADVSDAVWADRTAGRTMRLTGLVGATVSNMRVLREINYPLSLRATLGARVDNMFVKRLMNDPLVGMYGYSIHESSCEDTVIVGLNSIDQRHGWTDGVPLTPENGSVLWDYGRVQNSKLIGCTVRGTSQSAYDTHHGSRNIQFIDCTAYISGTRNAFALRGDNHSIIDCISIGSGTGVRVFTEDVIGESRRHYVSGLRVEGATRAISVEVRGASIHPNYNIRDTAQNLVVENLYADGVGSLLFARNAKVRLTAHHVRIASQAVGPYIFADNSEVSVTVPRLNGLGVTSATSSSFWQTVNGNGFFEYTGALDFSDQWLAAITPARLITAGTGTDGYFVDVVLNKYMANTPFPRVVDADSYDVKWKVRMSAAGAASTKRNGSARELKNADIANDAEVEQIGQGSYPTLYLSVVVDDSVARTVGKFPVPQFDGQRLLVQRRSGNAAVTIANSVSTKRTVIGSAIVLDDTLQVAEFIANGAGWYRAR